MSLLATTEKGPPSQTTAQPCFSFPPLLSQPSRRIIWTVTSQTDGLEISQKWKNLWEKIANVATRHQNTAFLSSYEMERQSFPTHVLARLPLPLWSMPVSHWLPCMAIPTLSVVRDNITPFFLSQKSDLQVQSYITLGERNTVFQFPSLFLICVYDPALLS